jgi:hypothetical protein
MGNNQCLRVVLTLGAAAGGLLAAAFLPTAVAFADEYGPEDYGSMFPADLTPGYRVCSLRCVGTSSFLGRSSQI